MGLVQIQGGDGLSNQRMPPPGHFGGILGTFLENTASK